MRGFLRLFAAEARACVEALRLSSELNVQSLEVEGDSLTVIKKANTDETDSSEISGYMEDVKRLSKNFQRCSFTHVRRSANEAANHLAREGLRQKQELFFSNGIPGSAAFLVERDRNLMEALKHTGR